MDDRIVQEDGLIKFNEPVTVTYAISKLPPREQCLSWGKQSLTEDLIRGMLHLASRLSEDYRYVLGVTPEVAQYLYDCPEGGTLDTSHFMRCKQKDSLVGHWNGMETHVIQEYPSNEWGEEYGMLLILDDNHMVTGYLMTKLHQYADNIVPSHKRILMPS